MHAKGLRIPRVKGGGVQIKDPDRAFVWVQYRRTDGLEGWVYVGEAGPYPEEPGRPPFDEVIARWTPGTRIVKEAGAEHPRLLA